MNNSKKSIMITGANGFVGARLCRIFLNKGFEVFAGVRKSANLENLDGLDVEFRFGDVTNTESLPAMVKDVDYIIHNAGVVKVKRKEMFYDVNEKGTKNLFEAVLEHNPKVKKIIYISSLAAAGPSENGIPVKENDTPRPVTTYGHSKLMGEKAALSFADKLNVISIRPPGIYGPGDKEVLAFFETINNRIKPYIGNIHRKLQLVHVDDLCLAVYMAVDGNTPSGSIYFASENRSYTMKELIALIEKACGKKGFPLYIPAPIFKLIAIISGGLFKLVNATPMLTKEKANELLASWEVSTERAKNDFGFESKIPFEEGARSTAKWYFEKGWLK